MNPDDFAEFLTLVFAWPLHAILADILLFLPMLLSFHLHKRKCTILGTRKIFSILHAVPCDNLYLPTVKVCRISIFSFLVFTFLTNY